MKGLPEERREDRRPALSGLTLAASVLVLLFLTLIVFSEVLFSSGPSVLSMFGGDLSDQFVYTRYLGFHQLRQGNLPLWNPYLFCGIPFFGLFQDALLYPLSLLFFRLPLAAAINWSIIIHVFLLGLFTYLWAGYNGRSTLAALLAGILTMFGGATYLHIFPGHLSLVCAMAWSALIFMIVDGGWSALSKNHQPRRKGERSFRLLSWGGAGAITVCLQVLAGHPQIVFVTAVAAGLYVCSKIASDVRRWPLLMFLAVIYSSGAILGAAQLAAGVAANMDSVRSGGVFFKFASMFSFPPENFLTLIMPGFFGDMFSLPYWGRCYLWEMNLFLGVTGFVLLAAGIVRSVKMRQLIWPAVMILLVLLALGKNTPLYQLLYTRVPGFDVFRGSSKFMLPAFLFMAMLTAYGYDTLFQEPPGPGGNRRLGAIFCVGVGLLLGMGALVLWRQTAAGVADGPWATLLRWVAETREGYLPGRYYQSDGFAGKAAGLSANGLIVASALFLALGLLLGIAGKARWVKFAVFFLAAGELVVFARQYQPSFDITRCFRPEISRSGYALGPAGRILNRLNHNLGMKYGIGDLWGNHPGVRRRYAELMAFSQGREPGQATQYLDFNRISPLFKMLRCGAVIEEGPGGQSLARVSHAFCPQAFLVGSYSVITERDKILSHVTSTAFEPLREVVLESEPDPRPRPFETEESTPGVNISPVDTDGFVMAVNTPQPAILVITDTFSRGWRAVSLQEKPVQDYTVMPANYALRAIPLRSGHHVIRMEYRPAIIQAGLVLSAAGWAALLLIWPPLLFLTFRREKLG